MATQQYFDQSRDYRVSLIRKALTSATGSGGGLIPQVLDKIVTDTAARLSPLPNLLKFKSIPGNKLDFNQLLTLPAAMPGQGEASTTASSDATTTLASVYMKLLKKQSSVSFYLQDTSRENIDALAFAVEATVRSEVYDFENQMIWANSTANTYDCNGFNSVIITNRNTQTLGGDVLTDLTPLDNMIDAMRDRGGESHDAFFLVSPYMQSKISQTLTNVRNIQGDPSSVDKANIGGGWVLDRYRGIPIAPTTALRPKATMPTVTPTTGTGTASGTYYFRVTYDNWNGEQLAYTEISAAPSTNSVILTFTAPTDALRYRIYVGTSSGACKLRHIVPGKVYNSVGGFVTSAGLTQTITPAAGSVKVLTSDASGGVASIELKSDPSVASSEVPTAMQNDLPYIATDLSKPEETVFLIDGDVNQGLGQVAYANQYGDRMGGWLSVFKAAQVDLVIPFIIYSFCALIPKWEATSSVYRGLRVK